MAISKSTEEINKESLLEISTSEFYFNKVRPFIQEMLLKCKTDGELIRTLEKVTNAADSFCVRKEYNDFIESFDVLETAITDKNYFNGAMKKAPEAEKEMVRQLIEHIKDLRMLVKCEKPTEPTGTKDKERLNYNPSPIGENKDFGSHNMKTLNEPSPKERIPNR